MEEGKLDAIRNPDGIWINTSTFQEAGKYFMKNGYYCPDPWGSPDWLDFWSRERERCLIGYSSGGASITGDHYFYLNYDPIKRVDDPSKKIADKIKGFPFFWDGDYNYFWVREIARKGLLSALKVGETEQEEIYDMPDEEKAKAMQKYLEGLHLEVKIVPQCLGGGYNLIVGKARRKGYSYKNSAIAANNFFNRRESYTLFMAYQKKYLYPKGIFSMSMDCINFVNANTAWTQPSDFVKKVDHIRASYEETINGIKLEKGFKSEIQAISFKDDPDAGRGKDAYDIFGEEVGAWGVPGGLKETLSAMEPSVTAGDIKTGLITLFGTSGDIEKGTVDFANIFSNPLAYDMLAFNDIWGKYPEKVEGFMHPRQWNMEGYFDKQGNSDIKGAVAAEVKKRDNMKKHGATSSKLQQRMQENPLDSAEAFSMISENNFPVIELKAQLDKVKALNLQLTKGTPVTLYYEGSRCRAKPILDGSAEPIISLNDLPNDKRGCVVIYEHPIENPPPGLYKIGYDPVRQDSGTSLAGIIVYKSVHKGGAYHNIIVAEYIGRLEKPDDMDHIAEMLADFYNTKIMYENEVTGTKTYFVRKRRANLLALQPDAVISKNVKNSKVARVFGCHMNEQLKDAGERYAKQYFETILDYDENGDPIRTIDRIYSIRFLEEAIAYHRKGNFDLMSAFFMCLFQVQEEELGKEYEEDEGTENGKELLDMITDMYKKSNSNNLRNFR